jgi:chaperonin cofactor prefoldin
LFQFVKSVKDHVSEELKSHKEVIIDKLTSLETKVDNLEKDFHAFKESRGESGKLDENS